MSQAITDCFINRLNSGKIVDQIALFEDKEGLFKMSFYDKLSCPLQYWRRFKNDYKELCEVAIRLFTVPASSAAVERTFSLARRIERWDRMRMSASTFEKCLAIKCFYRDTENKLNEEDRVPTDDYDIEELIYLPPLINSQLPSEDSVEESEPEDFA